MADIARITPQAATQRLDRGEVLVFVDVRDRAQYAQTHITGALSVPKAELETAAREIPMDKPIVTY
jgi:rhodanese-related sulfurtransferase